MDSWSEFTRSGKGRSAKSIAVNLIDRRYIKVSDPKFGNDSVVIMRESDLKEMEKHLQAYKIAFETTKDLHTSLIEFRQ